MEKTIGVSNISVIPSLDLIKVYINKMPAEVTEKEVYDCIRFLEKSGIGIEPDIRFSGESFANHKKIVLFRLSSEGNLKLSEEFSAASLVLYLASVVTRADGNIAREQKERLQEYLETKLELSIAEKVRLKAHVEWLLAEQPHFTGVKGRLQEFSENERKAIGHFCVSVACADKKIEPEEVTTLHRIFRALGFSPDYLNKKLQEEKEKLGLKGERSAEKREKKHEIDTFLEALLQESRIRKLEMHVSEASD